MNEARICEQCGAVLDTRAPEGLCPRCVLATVGNIALGADAASSAKSEIQMPRRFRDYELLEEIARGGMGVVYKARQISLDRIVAVKMILFGSFAGAASVQRFQNEARAIASLRHPNIVAVHEVGEQEGQPYFSMDYVEGQSLAQVISDVRFAISDFKRTARWVEQIAKAIHYAHQRGILHRDLKPSNVLIDASGEPHITDCGLAKNLKGDSELTLTGQALGSPCFIPPEQAAGRHGDVGPHSDVYSLGAILYHLLTGRPPFVAETVTETLQQVVSDEPASPRLLNPRVPRDLETICLKCLNKEPHRRYRSAEALAEDLQHWLTDEPILARPIGRAAKSWRWCRRKPVLAGLATSTAVLLLAVAVGSPIALVQISRERNLAEQRRRQAEAGEKKARREATKSEQVAKFLKDMLRGVGPSVALGRDTTLMRELLDKTGERLGKDLTNQPEVEAELRFTMGNTYLDLGESAKAEALHREALATRRKLLGSEHADVAASLYWLGYALWGQRKLAEAEIVHREALAIRKRLFGEVHPDVASSLSGLADVFLRQGTLAAAETLNRDALAMRRTLLGNENLDVAASLYNLAVVLGGEAKFGEAQALHREALTLQRKMLGNEHPALLWSLQSLGDVL